MTRGRFFSAAMPIYAILYIIAILVFDHQSKVAGIGALGFALIAVIGAACFQQEPGAGRNRSRDRDRKRD